MCFARRMARAVVCVALVALPASVARADTRVTPAGSIESIPVSADGSVRAFGGNVTPFGPVVGGLDLHVNPDGSFTGEFALTSKAGAAYGTIQGRFISGNTYMETLTFTGGTGKYAGVSGYADVMGTLAGDGTAIDTVLGGAIRLR
jgi:hypothetical protein